MRGSANRPTNAQLRTGKDIAPLEAAPAPPAERGLCNTLGAPPANAGRRSSESVQAADTTPPGGRPGGPVETGSLDARALPKLASRIMAHEARDEALGERAQHLLRILIESYIRDGQPVGSRVLSRDSGLQLSSATIRNVMADLEELGFVASPHTSAGRIPTDKGYRFFVDTLLRVQPVEEAAAAEIRRQFEGRQLEAARESPKDLIATVSQLLS